MHTGRVSRVLALRHMPSETADPQPFPLASSLLTSASLLTRKIVELASAIKATFEPVLLLHLYPRSSIDVYIQILEVDGCA